MKASVKTKGKRASQVDDQKSGSKNLSPNTEPAVYFDPQEELLSPAVQQAKNDLYALGIELDESLIARLQNNLGMDKIFQVAHKAAKSVVTHAHSRRSNSLSAAPTNQKNHDSNAYPHLYPPPIPAQDISFRHISDPFPPPQPAATNKKNGATASSAPVIAPVTSAATMSLLQPFLLTDMINVDPRHALMILKQLENRSDQMVEPQYRPILDSLIHLFRIQYARSPLRFIGRLLGRKWNHLHTGHTTPHHNGKKQPQHKSAASSSSPPGAFDGNRGNTGAMGSDQLQEQVLITRWILKTRYVSEQDFIMMLQRVVNHHQHHYDTSSNINHASSTVSQQHQQHDLRDAKLYEVMKILFHLLSEEKSFGGHHVTTSTSNHHGHHQQYHVMKHEVVDLWNFLTLLKMASEESRRSYDAKTSKLANDIEFWRKDNHTLERLVLGGGGGIGGQEEKGQRDSKKKATVTPSKKLAAVKEGWRIFEINEEDIRHAINSNDNEKEKNNGNKSRRYPLTVAELLGQEDHSALSRQRQGRSVMGTLQQEMVNTCDIPTALHSPLSKNKGFVNNALPHDVFHREDVLPITRSMDLMESRSIAYLLHTGKKEHETTTTTANMQTLATTTDQTSSSSSYVIKRSHNTFEKEMMTNMPVAQLLQQQQPNNNQEGKNSLSAFTAATSRSNHSAKSSQRMRLSSATALYWDDGSKPCVAAALGGKGAVRHKTLDG